jgi:hypothetical protein
MPYLPLEHPLPLVATFGVMLFPGADPVERANAAAYADHHLKTALRTFVDDGGVLSPDLTQHLLRESELPKNEEKLRLGGVAAGNLLKALVGLISQTPHLASWNHAVHVVEKACQGTGIPASRGYLWEAKSRYLPVIHLWCAYCIREAKLVHEPAQGYDINTDFQFFLQEAETIRQFVSQWRQDRDKAEPLLPKEGYQVPPGWNPPEHRTGYPSSAGKLYFYSLDTALTDGLRAGGRPKM